MPLQVIGVEEVPNNNQLVISTAVPSGTSIKDLDVYLERTIVGDVCHPQLVFTDCSTGMELLRHHLPGPCNWDSVDAKFNRKSRVLRVTIDMAAEGGGGAAANGNGNSASAAPDAADDEDGSEGYVSASETVGTAGDDVASRSEARSPSPHPDSPPDSPTARPASSSPDAVCHLSGSHQQGGPGGASKGREADTAKPATPEPSAEGRAAALEGEQALEQQQQQQATSEGGEGAAGGAKKKKKKKKSKKKGGEGAAEGAAAGEGEEAGSEGEGEVEAEGLPLAQPPAGPEQQQQQQQQEAQQPTRQAEEQQQPTRQAEEQQQPTRQAEEQQQPQQAAAEQEAAAAVGRGGEQQQAAAPVLNVGAGVWTVQAAQAAGSTEADPLCGPVLREALAKQKSAGKGEDQWLVKPANSWSLEGVPGQASFGVFGIFDGHGGRQVATFASNNLLKRVMDRVNSSAHSGLGGGGRAQEEELLLAEVPAVEGLGREQAEEWRLQATLMKRLPQACREGFLACDEEARRQFKKGGTTATLAFVCGWEVLVANVGDSCAYLDTGAETLLVSGNHRLDSNPEEEQRIKEAGGEIARSTVDGKPVGPIRVWPGGLAMSRTIGDAEAEERVTGEPEICQITIPPTGARLLIGSDGLWDAINPKSATHTTRDMNAAEAAHRLLALAIKADKLKDDITIIVVDFLPHDSHRLPPSLGLPRTSSGGRAPPPRVAHVWHPLHPAGSPRKASEVADFVRRGAERREEVLAEMRAAEEERQAEQEAAREREKDQFRLLLKKAQLGGEPTDSLRAVLANGGAAGAGLEAGAASPQQSQLYQELANLKLNPEDIAEVFKEETEKRREEEEAAAEQAQEGEEQWETVGSDKPKQQPPARQPRGRGARGGPRGRGPGRGAGGRGTYNRRGESGEGPAEAGFDSEDVLQQAQHAQQQEGGAEQAGEAAAPPQGSGYGQGGRGSSGGRFDGGGRRGRGRGAAGYQPRDREGQAPATSQLPSAVSVSGEKELQAGEAAAGGGYPRERRYERRPPPQRAEQAGPEGAAGEGGERLPPREFQRRRREREGEGRGAGGEGRGASGSTVVLTVPRPAGPRPGPGGAGAAQGAEVEGAAAVSAAQQAQHGEQVPGGQRLRGGRGAPRGGGYGGRGRGSGRAPSAQAPGEAAQAPTSGGRGGAGQPPRGGGRGGRGPYGGPGGQYGSGRGRGPVEGQQ